SVAVPELLRHWAQSYDLFDSNDARVFVAPGDLDLALRQLRVAARRTQAVVTGSFASARRAPVAAPRLLAIYCGDVPAIVEELRLLPAASGGNVVLLRPFDPVVWQRTERDRGMDYAAVSQVAVDCLTGNGRMPAEGEALLAWMTENERSWRADSLAGMDAGAR